MFRYAFLAAPSAVADVPKAAVFVVPVLTLTACPAAVVEAAGAVAAVAATTAPTVVAVARAAFDGARS